LIAIIVSSSLLAGSLLLGGGLPDLGQPITADAYTLDLEEAGYENGRLPTIDLHHAGQSRGCLLENEAAESWERLAAQAADDGVDLLARWCYRSLGAQQRTYDRNCPLAAVEPEDGAWASDDQTPAAPLRECRVPTAQPGNSNHGWGRAVDIKENRRLLTCGSDAFEWLAANAALYGWVHPAWAQCGEPSEEAWHWEWGGTQEPAPAVMTPRRLTFLDAGSTLEALPQRPGERARYQQDVGRLSGSVVAHYFHCHACDEGASGGSVGSHGVAEVEGTQVLEY